MPHPPAKKKRDKRAKRKKAEARAPRPDGRADPLLAAARRLVVHGRIERAVEELRAAVRRFPGDWRVHDLLGHAAMEDGRVEEAERAHRESIRLNPDHAPSHLRLGDVLSAANRVEEATLALRRAVALRPDFGHAWLRLVQLRRYRDGDDADRSHIAAALARSGLSPLDEEAMYFALAKIDDDLGETDRAFGHLTRANALHRERAPFAIEPLIALMERIARVCDERLLRRTRGWGSDSRIPVFIVGTPRCGSTLVEQIIASHPRAYGVGELRTLVRLTADLPALAKVNAPFPDALLHLGREAVPPLARAYLSRLCRDAPPAAERVCDKMLSHTLLIGFIAMLFPEARVIHCERHPMAIALSMYAHSFSGSGTGFTYDLDHIGRYLRQCRRLMAHWRRLSPMNITDVRYEDLVAAPEPGIRALLEAVDLPWDPACLEFYKAKRQVRTVSEWQVREPIHQRSREKWRRYAEHLAPLRRYED